MKFVLEIELGNDAMQTAEDVAEAIRAKLKGIEASTFDAPEGPYNIRDRNGNTVGKWEVKRDLSAALDAVADQRWTDAHAPDSPSTAQGNINSKAYHAFSDNDVKGFCDHCGMRLHHPDANHEAITAPPRSASAFIAECDRRKMQGNPPPAPDDPFWSK
jgi:hypothetical protein